MANEWMTIGLDYDGTITRDTQFWREFIALAGANGHQVVIVTNRHQQSVSEIEDFANTLSGHVPIVATAGQPKAAASKRAGYDVDVWVDDMPVLIYEGEQGLWRPNA